jgi:hypothetical protein
MKVPKFSQFLCQKMAKLFLQRKNQLDVREMRLGFGLRDSREGQVIPTNWGLSVFLGPLILEMPSP